VDHVAYIINIICTGSGSTDITGTL
jgi:hypothetical protein